MYFISVRKYVSTLFYLPKEVIDMTTTQELKKAFVEFKSLNAELHKLCMAAYAVAKHDGGFDLETTPEARKWHAAIDRIDELEMIIIPKLKARKIREAHPDQEAFLVLIIKEYPDYQEYSSRCEVETKVFGPYATEAEAAHKAAGYEDATVIA